MGKFLDKFNKSMQNISNINPNYDTDKPINNKLKRQDNKIFSQDVLDDPRFDEDITNEENLDQRFDEVCIQQSQKPESFHHFILENKYQDLEMSIRGYKNVFDKETRQWRIVRSSQHCFTDEEAEMILRTAQSHLATDIKLGFVNKESFPVLMDTIYQELAFLFRRIAEYNYGRYGSYEKQGQMKLQNLKIFLELFTRVQANYSRSIAGIENRYTHDSVKGQESLQAKNNLDMMMRRGYM